MGIPRYFRYLTGNFNDLTIEPKDMKVNMNNLYFDMNCLIHPCVREVIVEKEHLVIEYNNLESTSQFQTDSNYITNFEKEVYKKIKFYLDRLISISAPLKLVYIAIDGVAPRAKMEQQRIRRYKTFKQKRLEDEIYNKYGIKKTTFDTNCITPGTIFMYKLSIYLRQYLKDRHKNDNLEYILDDCQNKGEGEHKILQYIKKNTRDEINCIYGLDADLIMLALCSRSNVYLLREKVFFGKVEKDQYLFFDVNKLGDCIYDIIIERINDDLEEPLEIERQSIIDDYICICFLIGNDFLPHINGINVSQSTFEMLLNTYVNIYKVRQKPLVDEAKINFIFIRQILTYIYSQEKSLLIRYQKRIDNFNPNLEYSNDMELELEKIRLFPRFNKNNQVNFRDENWIDNYYKYYFNIENTFRNGDCINEICKNYVEGLQWNIKYYLDDCPCYSWYYKYRAAPCLRELCKYLISRVYPTTFNNNVEFTPLEQLSIVLPIQSCKLWANNYLKMVKENRYLLGFYPNDIRLDTLNKVFLYECDPILMDIDHNYIKSIFMDIELSKFEVDRNIKSGLYMVGFQNNENVTISME